LPSKTGRMR